MNELRIMVPTYNAALFSRDVRRDIRPEFGQPDVPVLVTEAKGIRIVLGSHDLGDQTKPDIQVERQPYGWMIFLHPVGGSDASGYVYFLDDGRSYLIPENGSGPTIPIELLDRHERLPGIDEM